MSDKIYEKVSPGKVADNIQRDAREAGKKVVSDMIEKFKDRGFSPKEVAPIIRKGIREGVDESAKQ